MNAVLLPIASGSEELEAVTVIDLLRRAGLSVVVAGLHAGPVRCARSTVLVPDMPLDEALAHDYAMLVLPGGQPGTRNLNADPRIHEIVRRYASADKYLAAICAAPAVFATVGLLHGRRATSFPGALDGWPDITVVNERVVRDGRIITARGPGTALEFALVLIEVLVGAGKRAEVSVGLVA